MSDAAASAERLLVGRIRPPSQSSWSGIIDRSSRGPAPPRKIRGRATRRKTRSSRRHAHLETFDPTPGGSSAGSTGTEERLLNALSREHGRGNRSRGGLIGAAWPVDASSRRAGYADAAGVGCRCPLELSRGDRVAAISWMMSYEDIAAPSRSAFPRRPSSRACIRRVSASRSASERWKARVECW
jgi:hypothetical protein